PQHGRAAPRGGSRAGGETGGDGGDARDRLGALYGALATGCGYAYPVIDRMTLAEAGEIFRYWEDNPPAHLMVQVIARLIGWQPPRPAPASSLADLAAAPPPGLAIAEGGALGMPEAVLAPD